MEAAAPAQLFVRNDKGRLWGPLTPQTLELLLDNGLIDGRIQVSYDGLNFGWPGRFEGVRDFIPQELWGNGYVPTGAPNGVPAAAPTGAPSRSQAIIPPVTAAHPAAATPRPPPGAVPVAGPGTRPTGAAPMAGPGAMHSAAQSRAPSTQHLHPAPHAAGARVSSGPPGRPPRTSTTETNVPAAATATAPVHSTELVSELPPSGDLARVSPIRLYYLAAAGQQTGKLTFALADRQLEVNFRKGNPEHVASTHPDDEVAGFLFREGLAQPEQLAEAETALDRFGGDLLAALFGTGALNPATAFAHLAQRAQGLLLRAVLAESGTFHWVLEDLPPHKAMPLGNRWGVLMELVRKVPPADVRRRMKNAADLPVMKSGGQVALSELRLTPQEARAMGFIDGVRSLNLLARDLPQDADAFFRLAWALREMDVVSFAATRLPSPKPAPPAPGARPAQAPAAGPVPSPPPGRPAAGRPPQQRPATVAAARPSPPAQAPAQPSARPRVITPAAPVPAIDYPAELETLRTFFAKLKDQNLFDVLGVPLKTDSAQVKAAYFKLARIYHPDTVLPGAPVEIGKLKADIFARIGEAYRTLGDDAARGRYLEDLALGGGGDIDVAGILHAEELFQKGSILLKAKRFAHAVELLDEAISVNPDEGEFYAWRGAARFFAHADPNAGEQEADADFELALARNPRCAAAWFFRGQIARVQGDAKKAVAHFKKTLDLQPDHLDAQREIRYLTKK